MPRRPAPRPRLEPLEDRTTPTAGQLDTTFHTTGRQLVPFSPPANTYDNAYAVAVAPDGGVVLGGTTATEFAANTTTAAVVKLTAAGAPDPAFGSNGRASFSFLPGDPTAVSRVVAVATLADGRVLAAGSVYRTTAGSAHNHDFAVARLTAAGQPDPTFGVNGRAVVAFDLFTFAGGDNEDIARAMAVDAQGRIVLAGNVSTGDMSFRMFGAARLTPGGQLDTTFDGDGRAVVQFPASFAEAVPEGVAVGSDGRIVLAGWARPWSNLRYDLAAVALTPTGQLDTTFDGDGQWVYGLNLGGDQRDQAYAVRVDSAGRVVLAGEAEVSGVNADAVVVRLLPSGQLDAGFNGTGVVRLGFDRGGGNYDTAKAVLIDPSGRLVVAGGSQVPDAGGQFANDFYATRLLTGGGLDPAFGTGGTAFVDFTPESGDPNDAASAVALDAAGRVVVAGTAFRGTNTGLYDFAVARLTADSAANTVPHISDVLNQTVPAGGSTGALAVTVSDAETAAASLSLTASSSNLTLVPAGAIALGGANGSRTVTVTPAAGQFGMTTITLTVTDGGGLTATDTFTVTVPPPPPPNTPPQISDVQNLTVPAGGSTGPLSFTVFDAETAAAALTVTASSSNLGLVPAGAIALGGTGGARTVTVTPAAGQYGTATITLTVSDGALTAVDAFTIDVPLPPPPPLPPLLPSAPITVAVTGYDTPSNAMSVAAGDFNNDGRPDAVVGSSGGITVFLNDGTGVMGSKSDYSTGSAFPRFVRVADLTGDGKPDILAANDIGHSLSIFRGVGDGTFQAAVQVPAGGTYLAAFAVADFTGDGKKDVAVVTDTGVALLTNVGGIGILGAPAYFASTAGYGIDATDFNHDAKADLVVTDTDGGRLVVYLGVGNGTFGAGLTVPTGVGSGPVGVIARRADGGLLDWNGDGHADLAAGCADAGLVEVFLGNGAGGFTLSAVLNPGFPRAGRLAAADFDADGFLDLAAQVSGGGTPTSQPVFVGDGAGGFTGTAQVNTAGDTDVAAADVNGDGRPDILGSISFSPGYLGVSINTTPVAAAFQVSAPATAQLGVPFAVTVTAKAAGGATFAGYKGLVHFTSTDGSAVLPPDVRFTPDDNGVKTVMVTLNAPGTLSVTARDKVLTGVSATAAVRVNSNPTAGADSVTVAEDAAATPVPVLTNDSTAPDTGETLTVTQLTQPAHGVVVLSGGVVTYAPAANYNGADSFTYTISDGNGGTATATVAVTVTAVNDPPTAGADALTVAEDALTTVVPVLGNDSFAPDAGETLAVTAVAQPAHGVVTLVGGVVRYAPALNYNGADSFTYTISDGNGGTATGTVSVTVTAVNDPPGAAADTLTIAEDGPATDVPVLANDTSPEAGETFVVVSVTQPAHGVVTLVGGVVRYAPAANHNGADFFTYTVSDGTSSATGSVAVTVTPVNDPPTAAADAYLIPAGAPTPLPVLANDSTAPDAVETLTVVAVTQPAAGGTAAVAPGGGGIVFTPAAGFVGTATFAYTVGDGTPGSSATAAVTVTVASGIGPVRPVAVGGAADGSVQFVTTSGTVLSVAPFGVTGTPTRTASGDIDGDGVADVVAVTGPGTALRLAVLSGKDGHVLVAPFDPFGGNFPGGGYVAAGDLDGDGNAEFAVTPDQGGGPRVTVLGMTAGGGTVVRANFFGIDDPNFRGGARAALGDVNGDGTPDVVVAAGFGGGPRTAIFTGQSVLAGAPARLVGDFFAFPGADATNLRNGSFVAVGDVTGDGFADLVFGGGPGGAPRVFILSGALVSAGQVAAAQASPVANFFVGGDENDRGGARVAVTNADGDAKADVAVGSGAGRPARVRLYLGKDFGGGGEPPATDLDVLGGAVLADGVYVG